MKIRKLCFAVGLALGLAACGGKQEADVSQMPAASIGASISSIDTNPLFQNLYNAMRSVGAENSQIHLQLDSAHDNEELQYKQIEDMIAGGAKVLVVLLVAPQNGAQFAAKMCDRRIPVVYVSRSPGEKVLQDCDIAYYVGPDEHSGGLLQAKVALDGWNEHSEWDKNGDGKIQVALLEGPVNTLSSRQRADWALHGLKFYPETGLGVDGVEVVMSDPAQYDKKVAHELVENKWLHDESFKNVEMILAGNDNMALGAADVLEAKGQKVPIFAINATPEGLSAVNSGRIQGTVYNDNITTAQVALRVAANIANDRSPSEGFFVTMDESSSFLIPMRLVEDMPKAQN